MYQTRIIANEFDKKEKKEATKLLKSKLTIPFIIQTFNLQYGLTRYDLNTGILSVPYRVETKHSDDKIEDKFFKKYWDIIIAEVLTDEQLQRKRKMQLELQKEFSLANRQGVLNIVLKNRILYPFYFRRYWMKMTYDYFDMKYVHSSPEALAAVNLQIQPLLQNTKDIVLEDFFAKPNLNEITPVLVVEGVLHVSIKHYTRELLRYKFCEIRKNPVSFQKNPSTDEIFIDFLYKLPNLFIRFNSAKTNEEILRFVKEDFNGLERFKNFWHFQIKNLFGQPLINPLIEWSGDRTIKLSIQRTTKDILKKIKTNVTKAAAVVVLIDELQKYRKMKRTAKTAAKKKKRK